MTSDGDAPHSDADGVDQLWDVVETRAGHRLATYNGQHPFRRHAHADAGDTRPLHRIPEHRAGNHPLPVVMIIVLAIVALGIGLYLYGQLTACRMRRALDLPCYASAPLRDN